MLLAAALPGQPPAVFRSGTRLVEVDVVVRDKNGPVTGLTRDDFSLYDCASARRDCKGNRRKIDVFREVNALAMPPEPPPLSLTLTPGAVSNRTLADGKPVSGATVVLIDQLNTPFDLKAYERLRVTTFLKSLGSQDRIALYSLGQDLHILQDFTDDPQKLMNAVARIDSGNQVAFAQDDGGGATAGMEARALAEWKRAISLDAVKAIVRHMEGVPGRKSLVWIGQGFPVNGNPPTARFLLGQANIAVYPVMVRSLMGSGNIAGSRRAGPPPGGGAIQIQRANEDLGKSLGGAGFGDAADALHAVRAAEEDSKNYYVLGFYPADTDLDGATHQLTLEVPKAIARRPDLTLHYRQVYLAARPGAKTPDDRPAVTDLFLSPLDATSIGLTASIEPDAVKPGGREIRLTIDLGDVRLERQAPERNIEDSGGRWTGSLQLSTRLESTAGGAIQVTPTLSKTLMLDLTDANLQARRATGLVLTLPLPAEAKPGSAHIIVQDTATGAAGSVRVPIPVVFPQGP